MLKWRSEEITLDFSQEQKKHWNDISNRRNPYHPVVRSFALPKIDIISNTVALRGNASVLEVGCGNGYFTVYLSQRWNTTGMDYSSKMLSLNPHDKLVKGNVEQMPFEDNSFDMVVSTNLLHHLADSGQAISEMKRVSRSYLTFVEPNRTNPAMLVFSLTRKSEWGAVKFSKKYLESLVLSNKLRILRSVSHGSITPNVVKEYMLPFIGLFNRSFPFALYNIVVASK